MDLMRMIFACTAANMGITKSLAEVITMSNYTLLNFSSRQTLQQSAAIVIFSKIISIGICTGLDGILIPNLR
jgi:hypothetical protein